VVSIAVQVTLGGDCYVNQAVLRYLLQQVVQHADARLHLGAAAAIEVHAHRDARLLRLPLDAALAAAAGRCSCASTPSLADHASLLPAPVGPPLSSELRV
jgi:hypothetical protein